MAFKDFQKKFDNINLVIIGEGELKNKINKIINQYDIKNVYLLGYKNNPFKYLSNSDLYELVTMGRSRSHFN